MSVTEDEAQVRRNLHLLANMDLTIAAWERRVAADQATLQDHVDARERFVASLPVVVS